MPIGIGFHVTTPGQSGQMGGATTLGFDVMHSHEYDEASGQRDDDIVLPDPRHLSENGTVDRVDVGGNFAAREDGITNYLKHATADVLANASVEWWMRPRWIGLIPAQWGQGIGNGDSVVGAHFVVIYPGGQVGFFNWTASPSDPDGKIRSVENPILERANTAAGGSSNTVIFDAGANGTDDYYNTMWVSVRDTISGTIEGPFEVTDYVGATQTATVDGTFLETWDGNQTFEIYKAGLFCVVVNFNTGEFWCNNVAMTADTPESTSNGWNAGYGNRIFGYQGHIDHVVRRMYDEQFTAANVSKLWNGGVPLALDKVKKN